MEIGSKNFNAALMIIAASNSPKFSVNVPIKDNYSNAHAILIHNCNADLINKLIAAEFSLSMCDKGLSIDDYCIR